LQFCDVIGLGYLPSDVLPPPSEEFDDASGIKKLVEYKFNEDGKKVKVLWFWVGKFFYYHTKYDV